MKSIVKQISIGGAIAIILAIVIIGLLSSPSSANSLKYTTTATNDNAKIPIPTNGVQEVTLKMQGYKYILEPSSLVENVPVKMTVDMSTVSGCMRDVVIPDFNVRKLVSQGDNVIEFTPTKTGNINIRCSMNMGRGTFQVVGADGKAVTTDNAQKAADVIPISNYASEPSGTCGGAGGGGCGCGAR